LNAPASGKRPHEEGGRVEEPQFTGSRSIIRWSKVTIGIERNKQGDGEEKKGLDPMLASPDVMCMRVLKSRITGWTGPTYAEYNLQTRRLDEI